MTSLTTDNTAVIITATALFTVTSVITGFITYKLRMKKSSQDPTNNKDNDKNS